MKLSHEEVREILSIVEASAFDSIEIKVGDISIAASKSGPLRQAAATAPVAAAEPVAASAPAASAPEPAPAAAPVAEAGEEEGLVEVTAPIVGTFYVAPEPGADPFVKEGDVIDADTTVGIIEVMKVFNNVRAEQKGTVVRCLVGNGDFVEFKQPILLIRPEG